MLAGNMVILRAAVAEDMPVLMAIRNDLELQAMLMARPKPSTEKRVGAWLEEKTNRPDGAFFIIADRTGNSALGFLQLVDIDPLNGVAEIGICLAPGGRGKGLANEALALLEAYAQEVFHIRKIIARVLAHNRRAITFFERSSFTPVGVLKRHFYRGRQYHDVMLLEKFIAGDATGAV